MQRKETQGQNITVTPLLCQKKKKKLNTILYLTLLERFTEW